MQFFIFKMKANITRCLKDIVMLTDFFFYFLLLELLFQSGLCPHQLEIATIWDLFLHFLAHNKILLSQW